MPISLFPPSVPFGSAARRIGWAALTATSSAVLLLAFTHGASLASGDRVAPITDPVVLKECGACHLAFQPGLLPRRSWEAMMANLANHFGEDASLSATVQQHITAYLTSQAGDNSKLARGLAPDQTPLRISDLPKWQREHGPKHIPLDMWTRPPVKSKANCQACHPDAAQGNYDEHAVRLPR